MSHTNRSTCDTTKNHLSSMLLNMRSHKTKLALNSTNRKKAIRYNGTNIRKPDNGNHRYEISINKCAYRYYKGTKGSIRSPDIINAKFRLKKYVRKLRTGNSEEKSLIRRMPAQALSKNYMEKCVVWRNLLFLAVKSSLSK